MSESVSNTITIDTLIDAINREIEHGWSLSDLAKLCDIPVSVLKEVWHSRRIHPDKRQTIINVCDYLDGYPALVDARQSAEYIRILTAQTMDFSDIDHQLNWSDGRAYFVCHHVIDRVTKDEEEKLRRMVFDQIDETLSSSE